MWNVTRDVRWTFSQNVSCLALTVQERQCFEDYFTKDESINHLINFKGACRTVAATPGMLITPKGMGA